MQIQTDLPIHTHIPYTHYTAYTIYSWPTYGLRLEVLGDHLGQTSAVCGLYSDSGVDVYVYINMYVCMHACRCADKCINFKLKIYVSKPYNIAYNTAIYTHIKLYLSKLIWPIPASHLPW